ncbi:MAG: hypothetical protein EZS28_019991, partial [Streblomastix strix]
ETGTGTVSGGGQKIAPFNSIEMGIRVAQADTQFNTIAVYASPGLYEKERRMGTLNNSSKSITVSGSSQYITTVTNKENAYFTTSSAMYDIKAGYLKLMCLTFSRYTQSISTINAEPLFNVAGGVLSVEQAIIQQNTQNSIFTSAHIKITNGSLHLNSVEFTEAQFSYINKLQEAPSAIIIEGYVENVTIRNSKFLSLKDTNDSAAAIELNIKEYSNILIEGSFFESNNASLGGACIVINFDTYALSNKDVKNGGDNVFVELRSNTFKDNTGNQAGAILISGDPWPVLIVYNYFINNIADTTTQPVPGNNRANDIFYDSNGFGKFVTSQYIKSCRSLSTGIRISVKQDYLEYDHLLSDDFEYITVAYQGDDTEGVGSPSNPFQTIGRAVENITSQTSTRHMHRRIELNEGLYIERQIDFNDVNITIVGYDEDGSSRGRQFHIIRGVPGDIYSLFFVTNKATLELQGVHLLRFPWDDSRNNLIRVNDPTAIFKLDNVLLTTSNDDEITQIRGQNSSTILLQSAAEVYIRNSEFGHGVYTVGSLIQIENRVVLINIENNKFNKQIRSGSVPGTTTVINENGVVINAQLTLNDSISYTHSVLRIRNSTFSGDNYNPYDSEYTSTSSKQSKNKNKNQSKKHPINQQQENVLDSTDVCYWKSSAVSVKNGTVLLDSGKFEGLNDGFSRVGRNIICEGLSTLTIESKDSFIEDGVPSSSYWIERDLGEISQQSNGCNVTGLIAYEPSLLFQPIVEGVEAVMIEDQMNSDGMLQQILKYIYTLLSNN